MSGEEVLCEETTSDMEITERDAVYVIENVDEPQKFSQELLNDFVRPGIIKV